MSFCEPELAMAMWLVDGAKRIQHLHNDRVILDFERVAGRQESVEAQNQVTLVVEENSHASDDVNLVDSRRLDVAVDSHIIIIFTITPKGEIILYRTAVRHAMMYRTDTWSTTKNHEKILNVNEMTMIRWMCGVTRKD